MSKYIRSLRLDEMQGASEKWTKLYCKYNEGTPQLATQQIAKSDDIATGFASLRFIASRGL